MLTELALLCATTVAKSPIALYGFEPNKDNNEVHLFDHSTVRTIRNVYAVGNYVDAWSGIACIIDGRLVCLSESQEQRICAFEPQPNDAFAVSPQGKSLADYRYANASVLLFKLPSMDRLQIVSAGSLRKAGIPATGHALDYPGLAFSPAGDLLAASFPAGPLDNGGTSGGVAVDIDLKSRHYHKIADDLTQIGFIRGKPVLAREGLIVVGKRRKKFLSRDLFSVTPDRLVVYDPKSKSHQVEEFDPDLRLILRWRLPGADPHFVPTGMVAFARR